MKSIFVILLFVVAVTARNVCTPGAVFRSDCNTCTCSKDGKIVACTDMICPKVVQNNIDVSINQQLCEAGKKFKMDNCTTCFCNEDGTQAQCTLQLCNYSTHVLTPTNRKYCTPGRTFKPDICSTCVCNRDGTVAKCTLSQCSDNPLQVMSSSQPICRPLSIFKDYCNTCFCAGDGSTFSCTKMLCDREVWNKNGTLKSTSEETTEKLTKNTNVCMPGKIIRNYCNTCTCNDEGSAFSCTRMFCDLEIWNKNGTLKEDIKIERLEKLVSRQVCAPNSRFTENCNTCRCSSNGLFKTCTIRNCDEINLNTNLNKAEITNIAFKEAKLSSDQVCEPGKTYIPSYDCNTCVCNEYGTDFTCITKVCTSTHRRASKVDKLEEWGPAYK